MKNPDKVKQGKYCKRAGARFELKVRADLESKGWIVDRWSNQVSDNKLVKAKSFMGRSRTNGFPDFACFNHVPMIGGDMFNVCGIEAKMKGKLSREEKEKCVWLLENNIFSKIFIASKSEERKGQVKYEEFK